MKKVEFLLELFLSSYLSNLVLYISDFNTFGRKKKAMSPIISKVIFIIIGSKIVDASPRIPSPPHIKNIPLYRIKSNKV